MVVHYHILKNGGIMHHFLLLKMMLPNFFEILIYKSPYPCKKAWYSDKNAKVAWVSDIAVPADCNVKDKEIQKIDNYQDLHLEIQQLWNMRTIVEQLCLVI